jgi:hypothetical protein
MFTAPLSSQCAAARPAEFHAAPAAAASPPLPPPRPRDLPAPEPQPLPAPTPPLPTPPAQTPPFRIDFPEDAAACDRLLADGGVAAARLSPIVGENGCGIAMPVALSAVILPDKRSIALVPPAVLRCDFAAAAAQWIATDMIPTTEAHGRRVASLAGVGGYQCRPRNGQAGAALSEHARGDALDLASIVFADGRVGSLADGGDDLELATALRANACARFATVLGPGADGEHETHIHLDLAPRHNGGRICQWDLQ